MPIPLLDNSEHLPYGVLPVGVHEATLHEIEARYESWGRTGRRMRLTEGLKRFVADLRRWDFASELYINGSYVAGKEEPEDMDILLVYRNGFDIAAEGLPDEENLQDNRYTRREYGINLWTAEPGSRRFEQKLEDLTTVHTEDKVKTDQRKGILRLIL